MMRLRQSMWLTVVMTVMLAACAPSVMPGNLKAPEASLTVSSQPSARATDGVKAAPTAVPSTPLQPAKEINMTPTLKIEPGMQVLIDAAIADLMKRLSVTQDAIEVISAQSVVWPDSSLGCPQPGMRYKQVPEDGALIILQSQGTVYEYHNGGSRGLFLCEKAIPSPAKPPQIDITDLTPRILDKNPPPSTTPDNSIPPGEDQ